MATETMLATETKTLSGINVLLGTAIAISSIVLIGSAALGSMSLSNPQAVANLFLPTTKLRSTVINNPRVGAIRPVVDRGSRSMSITDTSCQLTENSIINTVVGNGSRETMMSGGHFLIVEGALAIDTGLNPQGMIEDNLGNLYVTDNTTHKILKINNSGVLTTFAGGGVLNISTIPISALSANFDNFLYDLAFDSTYSNLYIADERRILKLDMSTGMITKIGCTGVEGFSGDNGPANDANCREIYYLALDSADNIYFSSLSENAGRIRKINQSTGIITTIVGRNYGGYHGDGGLAVNASLLNVGGIAFDDSDNLYIADRGNYRIRKVDHTTSTITTIAGNGSNFYSGDGGSAINAGFVYPVDVDVDSNNNIYIADQEDQRVRKIDATGNISTIVGTGVIGFFGDGGPAINAQLGGDTQYVVLNNNGNLLISDDGNNRIRKISCFVSCPVTTPTAPAIPTLSYAQPTFTTNFNDPNCTDTGMINYKIYQPNAAVGYPITQMRACTLDGVDSFGRNYVRATGTVNATSNNQTLTFDMPPDLRGYPAYVCVQAQDNGGLTSGWVHGSITRAGVFILEP